MADKQDNLAGHGFEQRVGEGSRDASEPPVGVKERCPGIKADSHRRQHATSPASAGASWSPTRDRLGAPREHAAAAGFAALGAGDEVIVVGDGPDPGAEWATVDASLPVVVHSVTAGFAPVCNRGAAEARGWLLFFLNDDVVVPAGDLWRRSSASSRRRGHRRGRSPTC